MANKLDGASFCFTGKLETMKRAEAEQMVKDNGGVPKKSAVGDLEYLVTNSTEQTQNPWVEDELSNSFCQTPHHKWNTSKGDFDHNTSTSKETGKKSSGVSQ